MVRKQHKLEFDACPTPIILVTQEGVIAQTNRRLDELFGYTVGELVGQQVEALVPAESREGHPDLRRAFFHVPTTRRMGTGRDLHGVRKDGEMIPVEIGLDPIHVEGEPMVLVSVLDIRERKHSEEMIRRALNAASSAMIQVGGEGKIELVNTAALQMFGYDKEEMLGQSIELLVPQQFRRKHSVYRTSYHNNRETRRMGIGRDLYGIHKNGSEFPVEIGLTPIDGSDGQSTMATINDISDRKSKELSLAQKSEQLERLNVELLQFAYSASHDLKAPLASIAGLLSYCMMDLNSGDYSEVGANLEKCKALADRLATRIEAMLTLAKSDDIAQSFERLNISQQVEAVWKSLETHGVQLGCNYEHDIPFHTVPVRFLAIVENLMSNAIKFRDPEQKEQVVTVMTKTENKMFHMSIHDNGVGIPAEHHDKIFHVFQRIANTNEPGSGLGLALVKKNVLIMGGTITFTSEPGNTVFSFSLPLQQSKQRRRI